MADIRIDRIEVDGKPLKFNAQDFSTADGATLLRIPSTANSLQFAFNETNDQGKPTARLRYRLEGWDPTWRELHETEGAKVSVQFTDADERIVGNKDFSLIGETPGWQGSLENSEFVDSREEITAPPRTVAARIVIYGPTRGAGMAVIGVDSCEVTVVAPDGGKSTTIDLGVSTGADLDQPLGSPEIWGREGSLAGMSVLRNRPVPQPHPILAVEDTDSNLGALWAMDRKFRIPILAGEQMTLKWQAAYSIGSAGPGVASYRKLPPGRYRFRVAAARASGELTGEEMSIPFDVVPPWYRRPESWLIAGALVAGGFIWVKRVLDQRVMQRRLAEIEHEQALERERSRIARDLHDDIGSGLTEIAMQSDLVRRDILNGTTADTLRRIDNVCNSAIQLTRSVDEIVWAVNPANDLLNRFGNYLLQSTEEFLDAVGIRLRFNIPVDLPPVPLSGKMRHDLFLAVREALNNVAKHTHTEMVMLEIAFENNVLRIAVEDHGGGFTPDDITSPGTHEGLANMRRRMEEIGGECHLSSKPGSGTRVEFILPLSKSHHFHVSKNQPTH